MTDNKQLPVFPNLPEAIQPVYIMQQVNEAIQLYSGKIELEQGTEKLTGEGVVRYEWLPRPRLRFVLKMPEKTLYAPKMEEATLHLLEISWHAKVLILGYTHGFHEGVQGINGVIQEFETGKDNYVKYIIFNIVNFTKFHGSGICNKQTRQSWAGRAVIETDEWRMTIDQQRGDKNVYDGLKDYGGFAVTHIGKLERLDGKTFAAAKTESVFQGLFRYLSFCRGAWVAPILPVGFDENGERCWEKWRSWKIERWKNVDSWFSEYAVDGLSKGFNGFYKKWLNDRWHESLLLANHWYVEANMSAGGVEGSIILAQSAFELLGWAHLVEEREALSEKGYENLAAMDKLRLLLSICEIPAAIPASFAALTASAKAKENNWKDGPQSLTEIRNALVHSNPAKRRKVFDEQNALVHEAWGLSLWYLELILLKTFNYNGKYANRVAIASTKFDQTESVPWV